MHRNFSYFTATDGHSIRYATWHTPNPETRGSIIYLEGRAEFIEKNEETLDELLGRGFDVYALDWRGQGLSDRLTDDRHKGYVANYGDYVEDLDLFMNRFVLPVARTPLVLLSHSMGAHIALLYLRAHPERIDRAILVAPMIDINTSPLPGKLARALARIAISAGKGKSYIPGASGYDPENKVFEGNPLTSDRHRFYDEARHIERQPELALGGVTYRWLHEAFASIDRLQSPDFAGAIRTPILMISGDGDRVVCRAAQQRFCRRLPDCRFVEIPGARHEILKETDAIRQQFWQHFDAFVR